MLHDKRTSDVLERCLQQQTDSKAVLHFYGSVFHFNPQMRSTENERNLLI